MFNTKTVGKLIFGLLTAVCLVLVGCGETEQPADTSDSTVKQIDTAAIEKDFQETIGKFQAAEDREAKGQLWLAFLEKNPESDYTLDVVRYVAKNYYVDLKEDPDSAIALVKETITRIADTELQTKVKGVLLGLYGDTGNIEELRLVVAGMGDLANMSYDVHLSIADAALQAGAWDIAETHARAAAEKSTPENIRAMTRGREIPEDRIIRRANRGKANALTNLAKIQIARDDIEAALASFAEAADYTSVNFVNVPDSNLNVDWAVALIENGDFKAAMDRVAPDAVMQGAENAKKVFEEAFIKSGGSESALKQVYADYRNTIAREVPNFTSFTYDNEANPVEYDAVKAEVTLLVFFFPT